VSNKALRSFCDWILGLVRVGVAAADLAAPSTGAAAVLDGEPTAPAEDLGLACVKAYSDEAELRFRARESNDDSLTTPDVPGSTPPPLDLVGDTSTTAYAVMGSATGVMAGLACGCFPVLGLGVATGGGGAVATAEEATPLLAIRSRADSASLLADAAAGTANGGAGGGACVLARMLVTDGSDDEDSVERDENRRPGTAGFGALGGGARFGAAVSSFFTGVGGGVAVGAAGDAGGMRAYTMRSAEPGAAVKVVADLGGVLG
jgi:hypothetical protein